ncbi:MAG: hypothetical protein RLZZ429_1325, partial [Bacteroidota bacterium]
MKKIISITFFFFLLGGQLQAQCPSNLSFDAYNFSFWSYNSGTYSGGIATYSTFNNPSPAKLVTIRSANDNGNTVGFLVNKARQDGQFDYDELIPTLKKVPQIGGYTYDYSFQLGNRQTGRIADQISYTLTVPQGVTTYNITYAYALVLQNPGHSASDQPKFVATVRDLSQPTASQKINCASREFYVGDGQNYGLYNNINYIDWQEVSFDLSQYAGKQISISFEVYDCTLGGHFGYAYLALRNDGCGSGVISGNDIVCNSSSSLVYSTPAVSGATYTWTLPNGWTGTSTSNSITVNPNGNQGGRITVTPSQSCGNIVTRSLQVQTVSVVPETPGAITGPTTVCANSQNITYSVPAVAGASSYDWTYPSNWTVLSGNNTNSISFAANSNSGNITVKARNLCGLSSTSSSVVNISNDPVSVAGTISGAVNTAACAQNRTLTLSGNTGSILSWQSSTDGGINWSGISGSSSQSSIVVNPLVSSLYRAVVKNGVCAEAIASPALIAVNSSQNITVQPSDVNICSGAATYTVIANGDGLTYRWQVSSDGSSWTDLTNANGYTNVTTQTLTINQSNTAGYSGQQYRVLVKSTCDQVGTYSRAASLLVSNTNPSITVQPVSQTFCRGAAATIDFTSTGPSLVYQWFSNTTASNTGGTSINGATASVYSVPTNSAGTFYYYARITSCNGSGSIVYTNPATINVLAPTTVSNNIVASPSPNNICAGTNITFTANVINGGSSPVLTWYKNGQVINGVATTTYQTSNLANGDIIYATANSNQACAIGNPASSNSITASVIASPSLAYSASVISLTKNVTMTTLSPTASGVISYSINPGLPVGLSFNTGTGVVSGTPSVVNVATSYTITGTSAAGCATTTSFSLEVVNPVPLNLAYNPSSQTVRRNTAITNMLPTATGGPIDIYTISPSLPAGLTINPTTGIISGTLTAQVTGSVTYTITGSNSGGSATANVVLIFNSAPTNITLSNTLLAENNTVNATIGTLSSSDPDAGDTHTYTLVSGNGDTDNAAFNISVNNLRGNAGFDFETKNSYSIRIRTTDAGGLSYEKVFTITISDVDEDSDGDGVMDSQEILDGTNPLDSCSFKLSSQTVTPSTAWQSADCDNDGLTNQREKDLGT